MPVLLAVVTNDGRLKGPFRERRGEWLFLLAWFAATYIIFLGGNKTRGRYLLPVAPTFTILAGVLATHVGGADQRPRGFKWGLYIVALGALAMGLACGLICEASATPSFLARLAWPALILGALAMVLWLRLRRVRRRRCAGAR